MKTQQSALQSLQNSSSALRQRLQQEHQAIGKVLSMIEQQVSRLEEGVDVDWPLLLDCLDYIEQFPQQQHHPLEDQLIALLKRKPLPNLLAHCIERIEHQHQFLESYTAALCEQIIALLNDQLLEPEQLITHCQRYCELQREHLSIENQQLLPAIDDWLSTEEQHTAEVNCTQAVQQEISEELSQLYDLIVAEERIAAVRPYH